MGRPDKRDSSVTGTTALKLPSSTTTIADSSSAMTMPSRLASRLSTLARRDWEECKFFHLSTSQPRVVEEEEGES